MTDRDVPMRDFTLRGEGYDRAEVDDSISQMQTEIADLRRALDATSTAGTSDRRLHDPEGAVKRTLAIAQETADRLLHDAQLESDRRRSDADEQAAATIAEAEARAARMLTDIEAQAAEVREQGIAAARSAIKVERDKANAELAQVRRVRNELRSEAVELKAALDQYRHQAREASDTLAVAASGPLIAVELPDYVDDEVALAGVVSVDRFVADFDSFEDNSVNANVGMAEDETSSIEVLSREPDGVDEELADVISLDADDSPALAVVADDPADEGASLGGTFLSEIRSADSGAGQPSFAEITDLGDTDAGLVGIADEDDRSDRFLSDLRSAADDEFAEPADPFFDDL